MSRFKNVNGEQIQFTAEEEAARDLEETTAANGDLGRWLNYLREKRNKFLIETDYLALSDLTLSNEMTTYRTSLRDITTGLDTVAKVKAKLEKNNDGSYKNFPTKPGA